MSQPRPSAPGPDPKYRGSNNRPNGSHKGQNTQPTSTPGHKGYGK